MKRVIAWMLLPVLGLMALAAGVWIYAGSNTSLETALRLATHWLPPGHSVQFSGVQGSVREGGRIGSLRWQHDGLGVQASDITVAWSLAPLLNRTVQLQQLHIATLQIADQRAPQEPHPPVTLALPLQLDIPFALDELRYAGKTGVSAQALSGHYRFDGLHHRLEEGRMNLANGQYQVNAQVQAQAPMTLQLELNGTVTTAVPGRTQPLTLRAQSALTGTLATPDARLALSAELIPDMAPSSASIAMQATVSAQLLPWQAQPIRNASARWQALDLALLWPQAPHTRLSGNARVRPVQELKAANDTPKDGTRVGVPWLAQIELTNELIGPWNQQRLPLQSLQAELLAHPGVTTAPWRVRSLNARGAGGQIDAEGQWLAERWQVAAQLRDLHPNAIDTRLPPGALTGTVQVTQDTTGTAFQADLQASQTPWQDARLQTQGHWKAPQLQLEALQLTMAQGSLNAQGSVHTASRATQGQAQLTLPGLALDLAGQLSTQEGQGRVALDVTNLAHAQHWLRQWPQAAQWLGDTDLQGNLHARADWQGGWPATQLRWSGNGQLALQDQPLQWQIDGRSGQIEPGHWRAELGRLQLQASLPGHPERWQVQAPAAQQPPIAIDWTRSPQGDALTVADGRLQITGPLPGAVTLAWQQAQWQRAVNTPANAAPWQVHGQIGQLPLAWIDAFGTRPLADLALGTDVLLAGDWSVRHSDTLHASLALERSRGDLRLLGNEDNPQTLTAGLQEASLAVNLDGADVSASLRWDSTQAGRALLAVSTQLQGKAPSWRWQSDAPVGASLQLDLPPLDAWSALAPPGWRLRGRVQALANLVGTRGEPIWSGQLQADELALRSVADGVDLRQGRLRAQLDGLQLRLDECTFQGAGGVGQLQLTGLAQWTPMAAAKTPWPQRVLVDLTAQASGLKLSQRADRRLTVSGNLNAKLQDAAVTITGALTADQALITLPSETTPVLGSDVVVRGNPGAAPQAAPTTLSPKRFAVSADVALGLGPKFQIQGRGLDTRLSGTLQLKVSNHEPPALHGLISTAQGSYRAWGQRLTIEQGTLNFYGPLDNPALDILAIRPQLTQRVGVQVFGTAKSPVVRLYADPELPEAEKMAWLLLGRAGSGAETALLQQAALALVSGDGPGLASNLTQALGLDELSLGSNAGAATLTLGKRLGQDVYMIYETGVAGTMGVFRVFYDLSRRLTLRAQTGEQSTLDLIWTHRYD